MSKIVQCYDIVSTIIICDHQTPNIDLALVCGMEIKGKSVGYKVLSFTSPLGGKCRIDTLVLLRVIMEAYIIEYTPPLLKVAGKKKINTRKLAIIIA